MQPDAARCSPCNWPLCRYDLSVELKHDREADAAFGWVLEMWGYSIACARLGIKNFVWQQLQVKPPYSYSTPRTHLLLTHPPTHLL